MLSQLVHLLELSADLAQEVDVVAGLGRSRNLVHISILHSSEVF